MTEKLKIKESYHLHDFYIEGYPFLHNNSISLGQLKELTSYIEKFITKFDGAILDDNITVTYRWSNVYDEDRFIIDFVRFETDEECKKRNNKELQHRLYIETEARKLGLIK